MLRERGTSIFGVKWFLNDGAPQPGLNRRKYDIFFFFGMIIVVYLGHGIFNPVEDVFCSKSGFGRGLKLPNSGTPERKWFAPRS